jgi:hypothetical protein
MILNSRLLCHSSNKGDRLFRTLTKVEEVHSRKAKLGVGNLPLTCKLKSIISTTIRLTIQDSSLAVSLVETLFLHRLKTSNSNSTNSSIQSHLVCSQMLEEQNNKLRAHHLLQARVLVYLVVEHLQSSISLKGQRVEIAVE